MEYSDCYIQDNSSEKNELYLYLINHNREDIKTHTYIGCVANFPNRLQQHNGQQPGCPRITRRAAGFWSPVLILELPADRNFNSKDLKKEWKQSSRGLESRIKKGLFLASKYNLKTYVKETTPKKDNEEEGVILSFIRNKFNMISTHPKKISLTPEEWENILNSQSNSDDLESFFKILDPGSYIIAITNYENKNKQSYKQSYYQSIEYLS